MAISFVSSDNGGGTSINLPSFSAGDLAVVFAFDSSSTTVPTLPAGWTSITTQVGSFCAAQSGFRVLVGGDTTTGTWTNATAIEVVIVRGQLGSTPIGGSATANAASNQINYPAVTLTDTNGGSWVVGQAASRTSTNVNSRTVTGMTSRSAAPNTTMGQHTAEGVASFAAVNYDTVVNTSSGWISAGAEVRAAPATAQVGMIPMGI